MNTPKPHFFDSENALALCLASASAYDDPTKILRDYGAATAIASASASDIQAFVTDNPGRVVVSFRGTANLANWLTDLDCQRVALAGVGHDDQGRVEVHRGFELALDAVWPSLHRFLVDAGAEATPTWFCGHSLGGALAMLAAYRSRMMFKVAGVYTFGQPRVGNAAWRDEYNQWYRDRTFRMIHAEDVIPRVPWLLGAYRHAGHEVFYDAIGRRHLDMPLLAKLPSDALGLWKEWRRGKVALLADHHVTTYLRLLLRDTGFVQTDPPDHFNCPCLMPEPLPLNPNPPHE